MLKEHYFKIGILILGIAFLVIYYGSTNNMRYQHLGNDSYYELFDTKTGIFFKEGDSYNPKTGHSKYSKKSRPVPAATEEAVPAAEPAPEAVEE